MRKSLSKRQVAAAAAMAAALLCLQPASGLQEEPETAASARAATATPDATPSAADAGTLREASVEAKGLRVTIDPVTRRFITGPPIPLDQLPASVRARLSRSAQGLSQRLLANGATLLDFQGRFQTLSVVSISPDGEPTRACVDTPEALATFLAGTEDAASDTSEVAHDH